MASFLLSSLTIRGTARSTATSTAISRTISSTISGFRCYFKQPLRASSILPPIQSAFTTGLQSGGFPQPSGYTTASEFLPISLQPPSSRLSSSALPLDQPEYAVIPPDQAAQYLAPPPEPVEYNEPLATSYFIKPPEFVDDPFPEINELGNYDLSYLEGVREKLAKSIKSVTGQINLDEGRS